MISPVILLLKFVIDRDLVKTREYILHCQKKIESDKRSRGGDFPVAENREHNTAEIAQY